MLSSVTCASRCGCVYAAETLAYATQQELLDVQGLSRGFSHPPLLADGNISYVNKEREKSPYSQQCHGSTTSGLPRGRRPPPRQGLPRVPEGFKQTRGQGGTSCQTKPPH